jgi:NAD(P)-dependent dehydrogenase (short-subunit alcohol dehydrogenase family)
MLAVVTGGLARLGAAIAARLAAEGYDLALHARSGAEPAADLARAIAEHGIRAEMFFADLADGEAVDGLIDSVSTRFGHAPDLLVNSAATFEEGDWTTLGRDQLDRHLAVNFVSPLMLCKAAAAAGTAVAVNIVDQRISNPPRDQAAYTASKVALGAATGLLARSLAPMRVNAVAPGLTIPTEDYDEDQVARLGRMMPLGRLPAPAQVADAVAYLAGADTVTGQTLFVDGGAALESYGRDFIHIARG